MVAREWIGFVPTKTIYGVVNRGGKSLDQKHQVRRSDFQSPRVMYEHDGVDFFVAISSITRSRTQVYPYLSKGDEMSCRQMQQRKGDGRRRTES